MSISTEIRIGFIHVSCTHLNAILLFYVLLHIVWRVNSRALLVSSAFRTCISLLPFRRNTLRHMLGVCSHTLVSAAKCHSRAHKSETIDDVTTPRGAGGNRTEQRFGVTAGTTHKARPQLCIPRTRVPAGLRFGFCVGLRYYRCGSCDCTLRRQHARFVACFREGVTAYSAMILLLHGWFVCCVSGHPVSVLSC